MFNQMLNLFITPAFADPIAPTPQSSGISFVMMFVVFFLFLYFAVWRPQSKRAKEQQTLMTSLGKGDEIVTAGGILGRISKIHDRYITLEVATNVEIIMQKSSIVNVLPKGTLKSIE